MSDANGMIPTYRGAVHSWECDDMGHMNVQFYLAKSVEALGHLRLAVGLSPAGIAASGLSLLPAADRIQFKRELRPGDLITMRSGIRTVDETGCVSYTEILNRETGEIAATIDRRLVPFDLTARKPAPWPDDLRDRAQALAATFDGPAAPISQGTSAPGIDAPGVTESYRGRINTWEADENGMANPRFHIHRFSNAMSHVWLRLGLATAARAQRNLGGAALDYDIAYHRPIKPSDSVVVKSGVIEVREKVIRIFHHMVDSATLTPITSMSLVLVTFDLERRKAVPIPEEVRRQAEALGAAVA